MTRVTSYIFNQISNSIILIIYSTSDVQYSEVVYISDSVSQFYWQNIKQNNSTYSLIYTQLGNTCKHAFHEIIFSDEQKYCYANRSMLVHVSETAEVQHITGQFNMKQNHVIQLKV